jgi:hypothetical protein
MDMHQVGFAWSRLISRRFNQAVCIESNIYFIAYFLQYQFMMQLRLRWHVDCTMGEVVDAQSL